MGDGESSVAHDAVPRLDDAGEGDGVELVTVMGGVLDAVARRRQPPRVVPAVAKAGAPKSRDMMSMEE